MRWISRAKGTNHLMYSLLLRFPYSFLKCRAYGGEVMTRLILPVGRSRSNSSELPRYAAPKSVTKYGAWVSRLAGCSSGRAFGFALLGALEDICLRVLLSLSLC